MDNHVVTIGRPADCYEINRVTIIVDAKFNSGQTIIILHGCGWIDVNYIQGRRGVVADRCMAIMWVASVAGRV